MAKKINLEKIAALLNKHPAIILGVVILGFLLATGTIVATAAILILATRANNENTIAEVTPSPTEITTSTSTPSLNPEPSSTTDPTLHDISQNLWSYYKVSWEYNCENGLCKPTGKLNIPDNASIDQSSFLKAQGTKKIKLLIFYNDEPIPTSEVNKLNNPSSDKDSYRYGLQWFHDQAKRYNVDFNLQLDIVTKQIKIPKDISFEQFEQFVIANYSNNEKDYDIIAALWYCSDLHCTGANNEAFVSDQTFFINSWKIPHGGERLASGEYADTYTFAPNRTFVHETAHLFGASDKYRCTGTNCVPPPPCEPCLIKENNIEKDIMCFNKPEFEPNGECSGFSLYELQDTFIHDLTAKELGWGDIDQDGVQDINDRCLLNKQNNC